MKITRRQFGAGVAAVAGVLALPAEASTGTTVRAGRLSIEPFLRSLHPRELINMHWQNRAAIRYWNRVAQASVAAARQSGDRAERVAHWERARTLYGERLPIIMREMIDQNPVIEAILREHGLRYDPDADRFDLVAA